MLTSWILLPLPVHDTALQLWHALFAAPVHNLDAQNA